MKQFFQRLKTSKAVFPFSLMRLRQVLTILLFGSACVWVILFSPQMKTWREQWHQNWKKTQSTLLSPLAFFTPGAIPGIVQKAMESAPQLLDVQRSELLHAAQTIRIENDLPQLQENTILDRFTRLIALEAEEHKTLQVPQDSSLILRSLTPTPPENVELIMLFVPLVGQQPNWEEQLASNSALIQSKTLYISVATRSAVVENVSGTIAAVALTSAFRTAAPQPNLQTTRPTFTGQELWTAVQNYRSAHSLPVFDKSNELCTVASIRVNELLELGKLDNHDGFQKRSDEFFERNPSWSSINENIAAGYQTAVQTVEWGWDQSLGHQALIQSREFPKACAAANSGFAVLVTGK